MTTPTPTPTTAELLTRMRAALAEIDNATDGTDAFEDAAGALTDAARDLDEHLTQQLPQPEIAAAQTLAEIQRLREDWRADLRAHTESTAAVGDLIATIGDGVASLVTRMTDQLGPDPLTVLYKAANDQETAVLDTLTQRAGLVWACRLCDGHRNAHDAQTCEGCGEEQTWPRRTLDGDTVWACCVSSIGPKCGHRMTPEEWDAHRALLDALDRRADGQEPRGTITWEVTDAKPGHDTIGRIPSDSEGTATVYIDGTPIVGFDLRAGTVLAWPGGEEHEVVARFAPVPDPAERPEPSGPQAE